MRPLRLKLQQKHEVGLLVIVVVEFPLREPNPTLMTMMMTTMMRRRNRITMTRKVADDIVKAKPDAVDGFATSSKAYAN